MTDHISEPYPLDDRDEYEFDDELDSGSCTHCGGDGYDDCDDPIQCMKQHTEHGLCPCAACGGTGLAKDQTIW